MLHSRFLTALFIALLSGLAISSPAQKDISKEDMATLTQVEDSLVALADSMASTPVPDDRIDFCVRFTRHLRKALEVPGSFNYPFSRLATKIHILSPEDKSFRVFNWLIAPAIHVRRYYGAVQMAGAEPKYYPLKDYSDELEKSAETAMLNNEHWYGCEYYRIMEQAIQGRKAYLLFGFNSNGAVSNKKILDVLSFDEQGPVFGASVFTMPDVKEQRLLRQNRVILEFKKDAQIYLNYDDSRKMVVFSRLISEVSDPNRKSTYIPTGQMDGLRWSGSEFLFVKDAIPVLRLQDGQAPIDGVLNGG